MIDALMGRVRGDRLLDRNWLKDTVGDAMHAILCAAGQNLRLLLRAIGGLLRLDVSTLVAWLRSLHLSWLNPLPGGSPELLRHAI